MSELPGAVKIYFLKKGLVCPQKRLKHLQILKERKHPHKRLPYGVSIEECIEILEKEIMENILFNIKK